MGNLPKELGSDLNIEEFISFVIGGDWGKDLEFEYDVETEVVLCATEEEN